MEGRKAKLITGFDGRIGAKKEKIHRRKDVLTGQILLLFTLVILVCSGNLSQPFIFLCLYHLLPCLAYSSTLKMEATCSSKILVNF
jgi:hypothetical protein